MSNAAEGRRGAPADAAAMPLELTAPAKLNLGLRLVGRRDDGYHLLESLFVPIDLADDVSLEVREVERGAARVSVTVTRAAEWPGGAAWDVPEDDRNLAVRAARAFAAAAGLELEVALSLHKRIPSGGGLGGGSSDAGAVLRGLSRLFPDRLSVDRLAEVALSIGADVPWFLTLRPALVTGIGEQIAPVEGVPRLWLLLANPGDSVVTAQVYAAWDALARTLTPPVPGSTMPAVQALCGLGEVTSDEASAPLELLLRNDLEAAAVRLCPAVGRLGRALRDVGALAAGMSGSGATVFGVFASASEAEEARSRLVLPAAGWARVALSEGSR